MDPFLSFILFGVISTFLYLVISTTRSKNNPDSLKLPPGKLGWPIIGETVDYVSSSKEGCYKKFFVDRMSKYSPDVFKTSIFGQKIIVFCGPTGNKFVFSNENKLLLSWLPYPVDKTLSGSDKGTSAYGANMKKLRLILKEILRGESLHDSVPIFHSMTTQHLESLWLPNEKVKAYPLLKKLTFTLACRLLVGVEDSESIAKLESYFMEAESGMASLPVNFPGTKFHRGVKAAKAIRDELLPIIKERRIQLSGIADHGKLDLLSRLVVKTDEDGTPFSDVYISETILALLVGGQNTTSSAITVVVYYLADHPDVYARILEEQMEILKSKKTKGLLEWEDIQKMKYSWSVANEVMRLAPPAHGSFKEVLTDFAYDGFTIPKGWKVLWSTHTTHGSSEYFPNPEKFDPSRFEGSGHPSFTFLPFGGGPRMCPGNEFARVNVLVFIHCLVTTFKSWKKLIPDEKITALISPQPEEGLPIQLFPRGR